MTHTNKETMSVICKTLLKAFKPSNLKKNWYSTLSSYHNLSNFSELRFSIIFSIFKLLSVIIILICQKLGSVRHVQQKIKFITRISMNADCPGRQKPPSSRASSLTSCNFGSTSTSVQTLFSKFAFLWNLCFRVLYWQKLFLTVHCMI